MARNREAHKQIGVGLVDFRMEDLNGARWVAMVCLTFQIFLRVFLEGRMKSVVLFWLRLVFWFILRLINSLKISFRVLLLKWSFRSPQRKMLFVLYFS